MSTWGSLDPGFLLSSCFSIIFQVSYESSTSPYLRLAFMLAAKMDPSKVDGHRTVLCLSAAVQTSNLKLGLYQWDFLCSAIALFIFYWTEWGDAGI